VPELSAARRGNGLDYAPDSLQIPIPAVPNDTLAEHVQLPNNPEVQRYVLEQLQRSNNPNMTSAASPRPLARAGRTGQAAVEAYYVTLDGSSSVKVVDGQGNTLTIAGTVSGDVPGVSANRLGQGVWQLVLPVSGTYTVTLKAKDEPLVVEINRGDGTTTSRAIRYRDVSLPAGADAILRFTDQGVDDLRYDSNGDGSVDSSVTPSASVSGASLDALPPTVALSRVLQGSDALVTVSATDTGSGVAQLMYSLNGTQFQAYTGPVTVDTKSAPVFYAFADDNAANRSGTVAYSLEAKVMAYVPLATLRTGGW
jgi:hypothetical protein